MEEREVVRAKRIEFVDDEGNQIGYIGTSPAGNSIGLGVSVEQGGGRATVYLGTSDDDPALLLSITTSGGQTIRAGLMIAEGTPTLHLTDAEGNAKSISPQSSD